MRASFVAAALLAVALMVVAPGAEARAKASKPPPVRSPPSPPPPSPGCKPGVGNGKKCPPSAKASPPSPPPPSPEVVTIVDGQMRVTVANYSSHGGILVNEFITKVDDAAYNLITKAGYGDYIFFDSKSATTYGGYVDIYFSNGTVVPKFIAGVTATTFSEEFVKPAGLECSAVISLLFIDPEVGTEGTRRYFTCTGKSSELIGSYPYPSGTRVFAVPALCECANPISLPPPIPPAPPSPPPNSPPPKKGKGKGLRL